MVHLTVTEKNQEQDPPLHSQGRSYACTFSQQQHAGVGPDHKGAPQRILWKIANIARP